MDDHRIPDRDLAGDDREAVRDSGQYRDAGALPRLQPVEDLGEEGVAREAQPQHLDQGVDVRAELLALASVPQGDPGVGEHGLAEAWVTGFDLTQQRRRPRVLRLEHENGSVTGRGWP